MIELGTYCFFDYTEEPHRQAFARSSVGYVDTFVPIIFSKMGLPLPSEKLEIIVTDGTPHPMFIHNGTKREIKIGKGFNEEDLGTFIHECVHWTQLPTQQIQADYNFLIEGIADYLRIVLSKDHKGDCGTGNNSKENLVRVFDQTDDYDSGSEYIAFLRLLSKDDNLIQSINDEIRTRDPNRIETFFANRFKKSHNELLECYISTRSLIVGADPTQTNRFDFFTKAI